MSEFERGLPPQESDPTETNRDWRFAKKHIDFVENRVIEVGDLIHEYVTTHRNTPKGMDPEVEDLLRGIRVQLTHLRKSSEEFVRQELGISDSDWDKITLAAARDHLRRRATELGIKDGDTRTD